MVLIASIQPSPVIPPVVTNLAAELSAASSLAMAFELLSDRRCELALVHFYVAQSLGADADECSGGRWHAFMLLGDMESAWKETDAIRARGRPDPHQFWDGTPILGKRLIIRCLHGYGDTIQMLRFVPRLLTITSKVILEVQPRLVPLLRTVPFPDRERLQIVTWGDGRPKDEPSWDIQIEIMEVPYLLRTGYWEMPVAVDYLQAPTDERALMSDQLRPNVPPRIGLVWTAGEWNPDRAIPHEQFFSLLGLPAEFWSLVDAQEYARTSPSKFRRNIPDASRYSEGILGLATAISTLSLLITTDTLAAHLAGALGVCAWVLVPYAADWRWMTGNKSPWYPSVLLFRQTAPGDWRGVIERVETALRERLLS